MADIVARLRLDNKDYELKLEEAKKSTKKFSTEGGASIAGMMGKFVQLAGAVAASKAAIDTFNAAVKSSQTLSDNYANALATVKGVVNNVVYSFANADFTSFERGLRRVAEASWAASAALDQLWNTKISASYFTNKNRERLAELLNKAKDETTSAEQRKEIQTLIEQVLADQREVVDVAKRDVYEAVYAQINKASGGRLRREDVNPELIEETLRIDVSYDRDALKASLKKAYDEYKAESARISNEYMKTRTTYGMYGTKDVQYLGVSEEGLQLLSQLDAKYAGIIAKYTTLEIMSDEELANIVDQMNYASQQGKLFEKMVSQQVTLNNQLSKQVDLEGKLSTLRVSGTATGLPAPTTEPLADKINVPGLAPVVAFPGGSYEAYVAARGEAEAYAEALEVLDATAVSASEGLGAIGGAISGLSGMFEDGEGAWLSYVGSIISAVGSALPALEALSAAQAAAAVTKTALNPWTVVSAVTAVGSIVAAMAAIPKFATGGVVPGSMPSGDNVLIRANSGEVVLTKQMAANLGTLIQRGGMGGKVVFEIKGDRLVGILNNHNKLIAQNYG